MSIHAEQLREGVIRPALTQFELWSPAAENLLLGTAAVESDCGHYLYQLNGPALGIYQIEPATHTDLYKNYINYRKNLYQKIKNCVRQVSDDQLVTNLTYATVIARLIYWRVKEPLPAQADIEGLARYWKLYYNTAYGKGTLDKFITAYQRYIVT